MRSKHVVTHGTPFYAGWGLTEDMTSVSRRTRSRSLDELVYIALVAYCRYIEPLSMRPCTPERLIETLVRQRADRKHHWMTTIWRELSWFGRKLGI